MTTHTNSGLSTNQLQAMARVNRYLGRLRLEEGQTLWLKTEVLKCLEITDPEEAMESIFGRCFAVMQQRLGDLYQGEEWEGRLSFKSDSFKALSKVWNKPRPIHRSQMASLYWDRSWKSAGLRGIMAIKHSLPSLVLQNLLSAPGRMFVRN